MIKKVVFRQARLLYIAFKTVVVLILSVAIANDVVGYPKDASRCPFSMSRPDEIVSDESSGLLLNVERSEAVKIPFLKVISNLFLNSQDPLAVLDRVFKESGDISYFFRYIAHKRNYFVFNSDFVRAILLNTDSKNSFDGVKFDKDKFQNLPLEKLTGSPTIMTYGGDAWRHHREHFNPIFKKSEVQSLESDITRVVSEHLDGLRNELKRNTESASLRVDINEFVYDLSLSLLMRNMFEVVLSKEEQNFIKERFFYMLKGPLKYEVANPLETPLFKMPTVFPFQRKAKRFIAESDEFILKILSRESKNPKSLLRYIQDLRHPDGSPLSNTELISQFKLMFVAGHDTVSNTLDFALFEISKSPQILSKIDSFVSHGDFEGLKLYADNIFEEALRLYPTVYNVMRTNREKFRVNVDGKQYEFPKNSSFVISLFHAHRDPRFWGIERTGYIESEFHPERFSVENMQKMNLKHSDLRLFSFGFGPRICIGASLATLQARVILVELFRNFRIAANSGSLDKDTRIVSMPSLHIDGPLFVEIERR